MIASPPSSADASPNEKTAIKSHLSFNQDLSEIPNASGGRYVVAVLAFLGFCNVYALRVNLSVAIVAMTSNHTQVINGTAVIHQDFDWDSRTQGIVLTVFTLLTPAFAMGGTNLLILARVIEGLFEGVTYPSIHAVWSRWAPPLERSRLVTIAFSGSYFGTVVSLPLSGFLAQYIDDELEYIRASVGPAANHVKNMDTPWKRFVTSLPIWAIMLAHFSENWGFYTLLTELPTFMKDVLGFDLKDAGLLSALPYLVMGTVVRKLCTCGAFIFQTVFLLSAAHSTSAVAVITFLTIAVGFGGFAWAGFSVNPLDIAPQFASIIMGLSNTIATIPGMLSPLLTGHLVQHKTPEEWQVVFYIAAGIYLAGAVFYGLFASGEQQKWAEVPDGELLCAETQSRASTEDMPFGSGSCD
ncbi:hypothetical protein B566_EDAN014320 [Ephemera danica]|nr:hypothetical protein B566_EDAN014320 [Ephemera danica]